MAQREGVQWVEGGAVPVLEGEQGHHHALSKQ